MNRRLVTGLLICVYLCSIGIGLYAVFRDYTYDDPFITYRYADNLARGLGFVYNPGERVLSTTTPLLTLLLAVLAPIWSDLPHLANLIGSFCIAAGGLFLWDLSRSWKTPEVGWVGLALYPTFPLISSTLGSETPLYLALCLGAFAFYARQRYLWTALCAALAILARPDGALVAALLVIHYLYQFRTRQADRKAFPWRAVGLFLAITLGWVVFAWAYFGSPLPATLAAKQHQGMMAISQKFAAGLWTVLKGYRGWNYRAEAVLAAFGVGFAVWRARQWGLLVSWTGLYFGAYSLLGVSRYYWYYTPLVPGVIVLVGLGVSFLNQRWSKPISRPVMATFCRGLTISLVLLLLVAQARPLWSHRRPADPRYKIYRAVGEWLQANTLPGAAAGMLEVGVIGYYAHRPVVDFAGLIQPAVAAQLQRDTTYDDAAFWAVNHYRPDYLVLFPNVFPRLEGYIADRCDLVVTFLGVEYGYSQDIWIYACDR